MQTQLTKISLLLFISAVLMTGLSGCGQKGPLEVERASPIPSQQTQDAEQGK